jgi:hypothetical protein
MTTVRANNAAEVIGTFIIYCFEFVMSLWLILAAALFVYYPREVALFAAISSLATFILWQTSQLFRFITSVILVCNANPIHSNPIQSNPIHSIPFQSNTNQHIRFDLK